MLEASSPKGRFPQQSSVDERVAPRGMPPEILHMQEELAHMKEKIFEDEWDCRNEAEQAPVEGQMVTPRRRAPDPVKQLRSFFRANTFESPVHDTNFTAHRYKQRQDKRSKGHAEPLAEYTEDAMGADLSVAAPDFARLEKDDNVLSSIHGEGSKLAAGGGAAQEDWSTIQREELEVAGVPPLAMTEGAHARDRVLKEVELMLAENELQQFRRERANRYAAYEGSPELLDSPVEHRPATQGFSSTGNFLSAGEARASYQVSHLSGIQAVRISARTQGAQRYKRRLPMQPPRDALSATEQETSI